MLNSVVLVGRVGQDPDIKFFETGRVKTTFSLAVNRPTKERETDWFRIELWGKQAEIARDYVRKGSLVGIEGRLELSRWTDAQGQKHEMPIIAANNLRLLGSKHDQQAGMGMDAGYGDVGF